MCFSQYQQLEGLLRERRQAGIPDREPGRGDGVKMGISVEADKGGLATEIAPGYMSFAIGLWRQTCN